MGTVILVAAALAGGYWLTKSGAVSALASGNVGLAFSAAAAALPAIGPNSSSSTWYMGIRPGTVQVSNAPINMNPNGGLSTDTEIQFGVQTATSVLQKIPFPPTQIAAGVLKTINSVVSMFTAHHAAALAAEGKALNDADRRMINAYVCVLQAVIDGEVTSLNQAQTMCGQVESDWYGEVKNVQRGRWPYTGLDMAADYNSVWIQRTQPPKSNPGYSDYHAPNPCNGACVIGHFFAERNSFLVLAAVRDTLAGNHGIMTLPVIPPHDTQSGAPAVSVVY